MGFMDKLQFWKREDDFGLGGDDLGPLPGGELGKGAGLPSSGTHDFASPQAFDPGLPEEPAGGQMAHPMSQPGMEAQHPMDQPPPHPMESLEHAAPPAAMPHTDRIAPPLTPSHSAVHDDLMKKDIELISSKLDALRVSLESINQRLANLERIAHGETGRRRNEW